MDVLIDAIGQVEVGALPGQLNPRGRIVLIAGRGQAQVDLWRLLGFVMSAMTITELAAAAEWINRRHSAQRLSVSIGAVLGFEDAAQAHATIEAGRLPRLSDGTVGRLVRRP